MRAVGWVYEQGCGLGSAIAPGLGHGGQSLSSELWLLPLPPPPILHDHLSGGTHGLVSLHISQPWTPFGFALHPMSVRSFHRVLSILLL